MNKNYTNKRDYTSECYKSPKKRVYLSGDFNHDMTLLRIKGIFKNPQTRKEIPVDEIPIFITYLALALQNISDIIGEDLSKIRDENGVLSKLNKSDKLWECASFLWIHKIDNPREDYYIITNDVGARVEEPDYKRFSKAIILKLWELRNMFLHSSQPNASRVLISDKAFYCFIERVLYSEALLRSLGSRCQTEKCFDQRLFSPNNDEKTKYEFTRKGIIFLICLALYKHDAFEFIQQFKDIALPPRKWELEKKLVRLSNEELEKLERKGGRNKAIIEAFTFFSIRSGRTDIDIGNMHYLNFANIINYLNKVPLDSYNYLELKNEANKLVDIANKSNESPENKAFKYLLHPRLKDRFLPLALAYIEDAKKLECIKFKRLDITVRQERSRYMFGKIEKGTKNEFGEEISDANGLDRHYAIVNGNAEFEYIPEAHYGDIRIARLRGSISENEILRLMLAMFTNNKDLEPNKVLKKYLSAYHRILERMLNLDVDQLSLDDPGFRRDFAIVSGMGEEALDPDVFTTKMAKFFPASLTRYFVKTKAGVNESELQSKLKKRLLVMQSHAEDFSKRLECLTEWKRLDEENRKKVGRPICKIGELKYPPRTCNISDAELIRWVLKFINLHLLDKKDKYRQLPRGKRHRGAKDVEFQMLHRDIGRFGVDAENLWTTLEKREVLNGENGVIDRLKEEVEKLFNAEKKRCKGKLDRNGKELRVSKTLTMLASAAVNLYMKDCKKYEMQLLTGMQLLNMCKVCGVKADLALNHESIVKIILGIDLNTWSRAFDYDNQHTREVPRRLENADNLVAAQIPVPNLLAIRSFNSSNFKFNQAFREFKPYEDGKMGLMDFYDVEPLINYIKNQNLENKKNREKNRIDEESGKLPSSYPNARHNDNIDLDKLVDGIEAHLGDNYEKELYGKKKPAGKVLFSASEVNKAIQKILMAERQDKILLACAKYYWDEYMKEVVKTPLKDKIKGFRLADASNIREFFTNSIDDNIDGIRIRMIPNDFAKPVYSVIISHLKELMKKVKPIETNVYSFFDLANALNELQYKERELRVKYLPAILKFEDLGNETSDIDGKDALYEHYKKNLLGVSNKPLTRDEFNNILNFRNRLVHPSRQAKDNNVQSLLQTNIGSVISTLKRFGCLSQNEHRDFNPTVAKQHIQGNRQGKIYAHKPKKFINRF